MILILSLLALVSISSQQSTPLSPCPNVFEYESSGNEPGRWYGVVNLSTDSILHSLWLNIVLDSRADILGNWIGDVTTTDNIDFKIENTQMKIQPGPATAVRFFVQYNLLNKVPRLQAIRLNGREICNAKIPLPATGISDTNIESVSVSRPQSTRPQSTRPQETRPQETRPQETRPQETRPQETRPLETRPQETRPQESRPQSRPSSRPSTDSIYNSQTNSNDQTNANPYSIDNGHVNTQSVGSQTNSRPRPNNGYQATTPPARPSIVTNTYEDPEFVDESGQSSTPEYFEGGLPTVSFPKGPSHNNNNNNNFYDTNSNKNQGSCGKVVRNSNPNPLVVNGKPTLEGQWPWQIALYQTQTVDNKYICGGTLVSHRHIITAAHCVSRKGNRQPVNQNTLTVFLGKHNLRTSVEGVQFRTVNQIKLHPLYNATSFANDLAILELRESVQYTDWVRPACLWPESQVDLSNVIGKKGSVVGWGFDDKGMATEELTLVEMPIVEQETCIRSYSEFFARFTSDYTYCAGYRDGEFNKSTGSRKSTSVCNGDSGGGMVFKMQNSWYLRGLVSLSVARQNEYRCDPTHYVIFTDLAKFLPWIQQNINEY